MVVSSHRPSLGQLLPDIPGHLVDLVPADLTLDSRTVRPGDAFVAVPGSASDGRDYIPAALQAGAAVVLAEAGGLDEVPDNVVPVSGLADKLALLARDFYGDPSQRMALIAVTGTNGKTSVVDFVGQILRGLGVATGCIGTLGARVNSVVTESGNTTPDVISINRQLSAWFDQGVDHVALEASSHALDQGRLTGLSLQSAIFTNLSRDHLDYHGDETRYANAKLALFEAFDLDRAYFNADDPVASRVRAVARCPAMGISLENAESDVYVQIQTTTPLTLRIHSPVGTTSVTANLGGSFNAFNLTAAIMAVAGLGYSFDDVVAAASKVTAVPGRMELVPNDRDVRVVVDYAHTPDALARALGALRAETRGRLWVVFGCGGDRDVGKRPLMAAEASRLADRIVVTSDNPRTEDPAAIVADVAAGISGQYETIVDRKAAIEFALSNAAPGDTVLIAGKGHETYQEVNGQRSPFSDCAVAGDFLAGAAS